MLVQFLIKYVYVGTYILFNLKKKVISFEIIVDNMVFSQYTIDIIYIYTNSVYIIEYINYVHRKLYSIPSEVVVHDGVFFFKILNYMTITIIIHFEIFNFSSSKSGNFSI